MWAWSAARLALLAAAAVGLLVETALAGEVLGGNPSNNASGFGSVTAGGDHNTAEGAGAVIAGGSNNKAIGFHAFIGGGSYLRTTAYAYASAVGGTYNEASGYAALAAGGEQNQVSGLESVALGGTHNDAGWSYSVAVAGQMNAANGPWAMVAGGKNNTATGSHAVTLGGGFSAARAILSTAIGSGVFINETHHGAVAVAAYVPELIEMEGPEKGGTIINVTVVPGAGAAPDQQCKSTGPGSLTLCALNNVTLTGKAVVINGIDLLAALKQQAAELKALKQQFADLQGAFDKQCGPASSGGRILTGCRSVVAETPQQPDRVPLIIGGAAGGALLLALTLLVALRWNKKRVDVAGGQVATSAA
jgi:hypothetical protein